MTTQTFIQMNEEDLNRVLQTMVNEKEESRTYDRYYSVLVPASWVAKIHSVTYQTVFNYIQRGMIKPVDRISGSENYMFRLSEVLRMDFVMLRKQLRAKRS